ncbi:MAG: HAD family phosphatase [Bacteroidetes bacterium]|nr:HAD family phosphatase [Bacteroidota bacterium]
MDNHPGNGNIRNIIFDFGGVIINISHGRVESAFKALGVDNFSDLFSQAVQSELFQRLEKGLMSAAEFRIAFKNLSGLNVPDEILDNAWNQIIGDYPPNRIDLLQKIKQNYRIFLLSNTNEIHYNYYIKKFKKEFGFEFQSLFDGTFWSFQRGKRKPDAEAFLDVAETHNLIAYETLFIDDSLQNVIAARQAGLKSFHLGGNMEITDMFSGSILESVLII